MKKHFITCAVVLSLIAGTFFIVFTFENMVFALARVQFLPTSASYGGDFVDRESKERIDSKRAAIEGEIQKADPIAIADKNSDRTGAVVEISQAATH